METSLPQGWKYEKIKTFIRSNKPGIASGEKSRTDGYIHLRMNNINRQQNLDLNEFWKIPASVKDVENYSLKSGDILFNNTNSIELVGKCCLFNIEDNHVYLYSNHNSRLRLNDELDPQYFVFWINFLWHKRYFELNCENWVNQAALRLEDKLFPFTIPIPPHKAIQQKISSEIKEKLAHVEQMRQAALRKKESVEALQSALLREVLPYKIGDILPKDWKWEIFGNLIDEERIQVQAHEPIFKDLPFVGLENIKSHTREYTDEEYNPPTSTCFKFSPNHILYGKLRPYLNKVFLPTSAGKCSMEILPLIAKNNYSRDFIAAILQSNAVIGDTVKFSTGGRMPRADIKKLKKLEIAIPKETNICNELGSNASLKISSLLKLRDQAYSQLLAIEALPAAILQEVFEFKKN